jgi:phospholipid/cholesterol/gamma-HCH transport system substrate-binding protein
MSSIRTNFTVGVFVIIGIAIACIAIFWLGMSSYLEKGLFYAAYFDESVQGLSKDSPVKYRGVAIGRVDSIEVAPDSTLIQVIVKIESGLKPEEHIVAQLKSVGITGIMFIELDKKQPNEPNLSPKINFPTKYPVIATKPSDIKRLFDSVNEVLNILKTLDLQAISDKAKNALDEINQAVVDVQMKKLSDDLRKSLDVWNKALAAVDSAADSFTTLTRDTNKTIGRLNRIVLDNEQTFADAVENLNRSMRNASIVLEEGSELIKDTDSNLYKLMRHLLVSMQNIEKATENLNQSLELISGQPSQLLFGDPPPARRVESEK